MATSSAPNTPPSNTKMAKSPAIPGSMIAGRPCWRAGTRDGFGSVRRCTSSSVTPTTIRPVETISDALGNSCRANTVAIDGPMIHTVSSSRDSQANATRRWGLPDISADHRARTNAPTAGWLAPARAASTKIGQLSGVHTATEINPATAGTCTASWSGTTRR